MNPSTMILRNTIQRIRPFSSSAKKYLSPSGGRMNVFHTRSQAQYQHQCAIQKYAIRTNANKASQRPFKILGLQQIAIGSTDAESMKNLWVDVFGLPRVGSYTSENENVSEDILKLGLDGQDSVSVEVDLMQPLDEGRSPKVHIPPLNHIGLWVDDLKGAVEWMTSIGVRFAPGGIRKGAAGHDVTFIHPKGNENSPIGGCGVLIELVQAPDDVIQKLKK